MIEVESTPSVFHETDYPAHWTFKDEFKHSNPPDYAIVGAVINYSFNQEGSKLADEILVWLDGSVCSMTQERYNK